MLSALTDGYFKVGATLLLSTWDYAEVAEEDYRAFLEVLAEGCGAMRSMAALTLARRQMRQTGMCPDASPHCDGSRLPGDPGVECPINR